jgi:hypothetical protein
MEKDELEEYLYSVPNYLFQKQSSYLENML